MTGLFVELKKGRHKKLWLVPLSLSYRFIFMVCLYLSECNAEDLAAGYTKMFYQLPLMNTMLMPVLLSVLASRLCDMEIKGQTLSCSIPCSKKAAFMTSNLYTNVFICCCLPSGNVCCFRSRESCTILPSRSLCRCCFARRGAVSCGTVILILQLHFCSSAKTRSPRFLSGLQALLSDCFRCFSRLLSHGFFRGAILGSFPIGWNTTPPQGS